MLKKRNTMLWLAYFESANYCGYGEYCVVEASSEEEANEIASSYAEEQYFEQDNEQYVEEHGDEEEPVHWANIHWAVPFDESHDCWKYYIDPTQKQFFPKIN